LHFRKTEIFMKNKNIEPELHEQTMNTIEKAREPITQGKSVSMGEVKSDYIPKEFHSIVFSNVSLIFL